MVFGRIDVYWPDGRLESYIIDQPTVSVGRAEGNTIALETDTISRYHFSLVAAEGQMTITDLDSANGTFVDGVPLTRNDPRVLGDVEEIQVGALRIIWRQVDESPTMPMRPNADDEDTARVERDTADFRLEFDTMTLAVWPAASASSELAVVNLSEQTRRFSVRVSGMPGDWLRINRPEMDIHPGETAYVLINVKPPRRPNTAPNAYQVVVEVAPADQPQMILRGMLDVTVHPYSGFGIAVTDQREPDDPVDVFLQNQGSGPLNVTMTVMDPDQALLVDVPAAPLPLQPGQNLRVPLHFKARHPALVGQPRSYPFIVQAQANNAAGFVVADGGQVQVAPRFSMWMLVSGVGIVFAALIVGMLALLGVLAPPNPTITAVAISSQRVVQGEPLILSWEGADLDKISVIVNQERVAELPGDETSITLPTDAYNGIIEIDLLGETGRLSTTAEISAVVERPFAIARFDVTPMQVVRNVVSDVSVAWDVPNAVTVRILGLGTFTNNLVSPSREYAAQGSILHSGFPEEPLELTIEAENAAGEIVRETHIIPIIDPECTTVADTALREGPDAQYQQVGTAPNGTTVVVLAQHTSGWLRVQLPGALTGWAPRDPFECAATFDIANLRTTNEPEVLPTVAPPVPNT